MMPHEYDGTRRDLVLYRIETMKRRDGIRGPQSDAIIKMQL